MQVEQLGLSEKCVKYLKRVGFVSGEDLMEFLETMDRDNEMYAHWIICFDAILQQLQHHGLWSEIMEQRWPSDTTTAIS